MSDSLHFLIKIWCPKSILGFPDFPSIMWFLISFQIKQSPNCIESKVGVINRRHTEKALFCYNVFSSSPWDLRMLERFDKATDVSPIKLGPHIAGSYKTGTHWNPADQWNRDLNTTQLGTKQNHTKPTGVPIELEPAIKLEPLATKFNNQKINGTPGFCIRLETRNRSS